jgi:hypothetical protein
MPIRRINSTGRKKILREDARLFVRPDADGVLTLEATFDLTQYDLPADARVFVEAYRQTTSMRFEYGTTSTPRPSSGLACRLTEFSTRDGLLFRVKVTSSGERPGLLLAEADQIRARDVEEEPDQRIPLLPLVPADLGQEVWRIDITEASGSQLQVNEKVGDWKAVALSPAFRSLIFPAALRQVLSYVVLIRETRNTENPEDWRCRWLQFASSLPGVADLPPADSDELDDWDQWIDSVVASFSRQHQTFNQYKAHIETEASE